VSGWAKNGDFGIRILPQFENWAKMALKVGREGSDGSIFKVPANCKFFKSKKEVIDIRYWQKPMPKSTSKN
jgi:hypothetical protein